MISIMTRGGTHAGGWLVTRGRQERERGMEGETEGSQQMEGGVEGRRNVQEGRQMDQVDESGKVEEERIKEINEMWRET